MSDKVRWCYRSMLQAQYIGLCLSEGAFILAMDHLKVPKLGRPEFILSNATTYYFTNPKQGRTAVVCLRLRPKLTLVQINALLVHEAVHIWRSELRYMRETEMPSEEIECYAIQNLAQSLMQEYYNATKRRRKK